MEQIKEIVDVEIETKKKGLPKNYLEFNKIKSIGLCDTTNLCGALEFAEKISKIGTQPIIGTQINFKIEETIGLLPLFALNEIGYKNINIADMTHKSRDSIGINLIDLEELPSEDLIDSIREIEHVISVRLCN